jgi:hypothetical protein
MDEKRIMLRHFLAALAYRTQKALRDAPPEFPEFADAIAHFHEMVEDLARHLENGSPMREITPEVLLQGPFSDAMTHAGQLALLRRLAGSPVPPENFIFATITPENLTPNQALPVSPDAHWPEKP